MGLWIVDQTPINVHKVIHGQTFGKWRKALLTNDFVVMFGHGCNIWPLFKIRVHWFKLIFFANKVNEGT